MKKVAIVNCLKANEVCTGAGCMQAFNRREALFSRYGDEPLELAAFMRCNGCGNGPDKNKGLAEKLERLCDMGVQVVHVGVCTIDSDTWEECELITEAMELLQEKGIDIVRGTHA